MERLRWLLRLASTPSVLVFAGCLALASIAYAVVVNGYFLSDDFIVTALFQPGGGRWQHVAKTFVGDWRGYGGMPVKFFRPLVIVTQAIDAEIWGLNPVGFHVTNIVLHATTGSLLFCVARLIGASRAAACFAALSFVVYPLHGESVAWISGRTDLVAAIFTLGSIAGFLAFRRTGRLVPLLASFALCACALMSKEPAAALPLMIASLDLVLPRQTSKWEFLRQTVAPLFVFGALTVLYFWWRKRVLGDIHGGWRPYYADPAWSISHFGGDLLTNLRIFVSPYNRQIPNQTALEIGSLLIATTVGAAALANALSRRVPWRLILTVVAAFFASLVPVANFTMLVNLNTTRMWYLPIAWLCLIVALLILQRPRPWSLAVAAGELGGTFVMLRANLLPWIEAGETMGRLRTVYADAFGAYDGEPIVDLPPIDRGAYLALFNAANFGRPLVQAPPRADQQAKLSATYVPETRSLRIEPDDGWLATERLYTDRNTAVWLWDFEEPPLVRAQLENCVSVHESPDGTTFMATTDAPSFIRFADRDFSPPESEGLRETAYLRIAPPPEQAPRMFWVSRPGEYFNAPNSATLHPELGVVDGKAVSRLESGYQVFAVDLSRNPHWPGIHAVRAVRLDPVYRRGRYTIALFDIARELRGVQ